MITIRDKSLQEAWRRFSDDIYEHACTEPEAEAGIRGSAFLCPVAEWVRREIKAEPHTKIKVVVTPTRITLFQKGSPLEIPLSGRFTRFIVGFDKSRAAETTYAGAAALINNLERETDSDHV